MKIWFPEREVIEDHDIAADATEIQVDGIDYRLVPIPDDPNADMTARRKGVA